MLKKLNYKFHMQSTENPERGHTTILRERFS